MVTDISADSGVSALAGRLVAAHHGLMENGHGLRNFLLLIVGLVVVGAVAWWVVKALLSVALYLLGIALPVLVVGGVVYLVWRSRRSLTGRGRRGIGS
ncbi:MAG: hypothetical protein J2P15_19695 [Micromonosporaceae bacterium]|nr:hypothetical protein [Micromonosporaceae bacterium]